MVSKVGRRAVTIGYQTEFYGNFKVTPALKPEHIEFLQKFNQTRRMKRDVTKLPETHFGQLLMGAHGEEGAYYVSGGGEYRQADEASIIDYNKAPADQPNLWCQWVAADGGQVIEWDESEKFYDAPNWMAYLIKHFLEPWGYTVNGTVEARGDDPNDRWLLHVDDNRVATEAQHVVGTGTWVEVTV